MTLPNDVARCAGVSYTDEDGTSWREGCETCLRRTALPPTSPWASCMKPPPIIAMWCEYLIEPETTA